MRHARKIRTLLVASRGEIANRTVSIYSQEDRFSLHRMKADESYLVGEGKGPVGAYLDIDDTRWHEVATADAQVDERFGDIVKATPSSKVVGDTSKHLIIRFVATSDMHDDVTRTVFFELYGQPGSVKVPDRTKVAKRPPRREAEADRPDQGSTSTRRSCWPCSRGSGW